MNLSSMIEFEAFYENIPGALSLSSNGAVEKLFLLEKYFIRAPLLGTKTSCPSLSGAWPLVTTVAVHYRRPLISPSVYGEERLQTYHMKEKHPMITYL